VSSSPTVDEIVRGAVDLHCHPGPGPLPRKFDLREGATHYASAGFSGAVAKSHHHATTTDIDVAGKVGLDTPGFTFFGSIALNAAVGGLNPYAVELALHYGAKIVWLPTFDARNHHVWSRAHASPQLGGKVRHFGTLDKPIVDVVDDSGRPLPETDIIIGLVRDADAILASGHVGVAEALTIFARARDLGLTKLIATHAAVVMEATEHQMIELAEIGAYIEHTSVVMRPTVGEPFDDEIQRFSAADVAQWISAIGPARTVLSSDCGSVVSAPMPADSIKTAVSGLLDAGVSVSDIRQMLVDNPRTLLGEL
jgi:Family of unknown function (DUF6282)